GINASHLSDYLVDEVLDNVDVSTRHFLLKSAILRSMNDALIVSQGHLIAHGTPTEILQDEHVKRVYLGEDFRL
ncbi:hypothetical protein ONJ16_27725, partial [Salmonella enterica subsp. enterica serovar Montevideo]|nr:hypothetical protein [Salmonella enterica subsp. enterica serovar Montevideo]